MIIRYIIVGFFSLTALSVFTYQGVEVFHAVSDILKSKS
ncbi:hypothetical protein [Oceanobacillus iheyensis HTE831]|uniref:Uncharacterized protein n=1 Tax=Oceanobacillus iheyensis (strain DSM 14371 / CIP 107618 / JCM 11309 / KCTC 3954 / HTE831) TaxID=221109 RepID=Q8ETE3_OCEIH|nr:hypothetical protein [Oceanobacillus iheyensis HTE831]